MGYVEFAIVRPMLKVYKKKTATPAILILDFFEKIFPPEPVVRKKKVHYSHRIGFLSRRTMLQNHSRGHNENCDGGARILTSLPI
jgi:hypothetical protein